MTDKERFVEFLTLMCVAYFDMGDYLIIEDKGRVDVNFNDDGSLHSIESIESYQD